MKGQSWPFSYIETPFFSPTFTDIESLPNLWYFVSILYDFDRKFGQFTRYAPSSNNTQFDFLI